MKLIISPAKKMREDTDSFACRGLPVFLPQAQELLAVLHSMNAEQLKRLWGCSEKLVQLNLERLACMDLVRARTPAILSYEGIQYQYMAPRVFSGNALEYAQQNLRILSGFYGIVKPFDGVKPYRLEMQAKLKTEKGNNLYEYWGSMISDVLCTEDDTILNLASAEYSSSVFPYLPVSTHFISCMFVQYKGTKLVEKGTLCKMARGDMVRFLAENQIQCPEEVKEYTGLGYHFSQEHSSDHIYTFIKEES